MRLFLMLIVMLVMFAVIFKASDDRNSAAIIGSDGYIESGSKFGIKIGMDRNVAASKLRARGLGPVSTTDLKPGQCLGHPYPPDHHMELWYDRTWRRGTICLASKNDKIVSIAWSYGIELP